MELRFIQPEPSTFGLVAYYKLWFGLTGPTTVFDYSLGGATGTVTGTNIAPAYPGFSFNGTDDFIDIGNHGGAIKSIVVWVKATDIVADFDYPIDLNGTDFMVIGAGTVSANGFAGSTIYIDGVVASTITAGKWHFIALTVSSAKTASDFDIGRAEGQGLFDGLIGETMLFDIALDATQVKSIYEITRSGYSV